MSRHVSRLTNPRTTCRRAGIGGAKAGIVEIQDFALAKLIERKHAYVDMWQQRCQHKYSCSSRYGMDG